MTFLVWKPDGEGVYSLTLYSLHPTVALIRAARMVVDPSQDVESAQRSDKLKFYLRGVNYFLFLQTYLITRYYPISKVFQGRTQKKPSLLRRSNSHRQIIPQE